MTAAGRRRRSRGSLLVEAGMSALMLMIAMTIVVQVVASVAHSRRAWDRRMIAANEASNLIERISSTPFNALPTGPVADLTPSVEAKSSLPSLEIKADVAADDPTGGPGSKRIAVRIRWRNLAGDWEAPVRLTTWIHRRKEGS